MFLYIRTSIFLNYLFQTRHITREPESLVSRGTNSNLKNSGKFENKILSKCTSVMSLNTSIDSDYGNL